MTDQANAELIAESRRLARHSFVSVPKHANMLDHLTDALEAAEKRAEEAERERDSAMKSYADYMRIRRERDQLAAVVEKVREEEQGAYESIPAHNIDLILSTASTDALREHDAALIEGLADEATKINDDIPHFLWGHATIAARWLREKARQRREEQGG